MTLLIYVILVALSVSYVTELFGFLFQIFPFIGLLKNILIPILAAGFLTLLDIQGPSLLLSTLAVSFISTAIHSTLKSLAKPKVITRGPQNRRY